MHVELVVLDGEAGETLVRRQSAAMRDVLQWVHDHPDNVADDTGGADQAW